MILQQLLSLPKFFTVLLLSIIFCFFSKAGFAGNEFAVYSSLKLRKELPSKSKTISIQSIIWQGREFGKKNRKVLCLDKITDRLKFGTSTTVASFVFADLMKREGKEMAKPCGKKYIRYKNRPKRKEALWVKISYINQKGEEKTGYTPITNFSTKSFPNKNLDKIITLSKLKTHGLLYGRRRWKLPPITKASHLDVLGWHNYLGKQILKYNKIVVSRDELEYFIDISNSYQFKYIGEAIRVPNHFGSIPPLIQPISFNPALNVGIIYEDKIDFIKVSKMKSETLFTYIPGSADYCSRRKLNCTYKHPIPLIFVIANKLKQNPLVFLLLSENAFQDLYKDRDKIIIKTDKSPVQDGSCLKGHLYNTSCDINGDGMSEIIYKKEEYYLKDNCEEEENGYTLIHIAMAHNGSWYRTAFSAPGNDGSEGF